MAQISGHNGFSRQSETTEQHGYEQQIHDEQHSQPENATMNASTDSKATDSSLRGKMKGFYHKVIKPAFPEAIQDVKILAGITALEHRVKKEISDPTLFPEVNHIAEVRIGAGLCAEETAYLTARRLRIREKFAAYIGVPTESVHPDDVPTIAFGGSGGGFRAMIGCLGYCREMQRAGLWDCLSYVSGVSGSCWSLASFYTFGNANFDHVIDHC